MRTLSQFQARVYFVIKKFGPMGPSQIGHRLEFQYDVASASVSRPLRFLVKEGLVQKLAVNQRVVQYAVIGDPPPFRILNDGMDPDSMNQELPNGHPASQGRAAALLQERRIRPDVGGR
jgi:hypothetical protein